MSSRGVEWSCPARLQGTPGGLWAPQEGHPSHLRSFPRAPGGASSFLGLTPRKHSQRRDRRPIKVELWVTTDGFSFSISLSQMVPGTFVY